MLDYALLDALAAVIRTGSFEKAAQQLHVTPSAVSQRIKLLEERMGSVLVVRGQPCTATDAGRRLCRHAEDVNLLEHALRQDLGAGGQGERPTSVRIAINADSLATWFIDAMASVEDRLFDIVLDDEGHSADWLRRGEVSAAVSGDPAPVQGCKSKPLGALRYVATASPAYVSRWFANGVDETSLSRAPTMNFDPRDTLQARWIVGLLDKPLTPPTHWFPATQTFIDATVAGLGWAMNPKMLIAEHLKDGRLVELPPKRHLDVPLYWHWSGAVEKVLGDVTASVQKAATRHLIRPTAARSNI